MVTPILDRTHAFKKVIAVLCVVCTLAFTAAAIELRPGNAVLLYVLFGIVGAAYVPSTTAFVELGCEVAYPVPESTSSGKEQSMVLQHVHSCARPSQARPLCAGILFMVCQVMAICFVVLANRMMAADEAEALKWIMCGAVALTLVLLTFFDGKLKRLLVDQAGRTAPLSQPV